MKVVNLVLFFLALFFGVLALVVNNEFKCCWDTLVLTQIQLEVLHETFILRPETISENEVGIEIRNIMLDIGTVSTGSSGIIGDWTESERWKIYKNWRMENYHNWKMVRLGVGRRDHGVVDVLRLGADRRDFDVMEEQ